MRRSRHSLVLCTVSVALLLTFPLVSFGLAHVEKTWSGTWSTNFNSMTLKQTGGSVEGTYEYDEGHIQGAAIGNVFKGRWDEAPTRTGPNDAGPFEFTMSSDGKSFTGRWRHDGDSGWAGSWNGTCSAGLCRTNGAAGRSQVTIFLRGSQFVPGAANLRHGGTLRICNRSATIWKPFAASKYNKFSRTIPRGACASYTVRNPTARQIRFAVFDEIKAQAKLSVVVHPRF